MNLGIAKINAKNRLPVQGSEEGERNASFGIIPPQIGFFAVILHLD